MMGPSIYSSKFAENILNDAVLRESMINIRYWPAIRVVLDEFYLLTVRPRKWPMVVSTITFENTNRLLVLMEPHILNLNVY